MNEWYPKEKKELNEALENYLSEKISVGKNQEIHGLIVPHAGYIFSGKISGKAFSLLNPKKINKAVILGPSHYAGFYGMRALGKAETPLGKPKISSSNFQKIGYEHSVDNQIPFLQKLNQEIEILPLIVGEISTEDAEKIARQIADKEDVYIFSTDLSHFLDYDEAVKIDKKTINIIENLDFDRANEIDACGKFPLLIMMQLCRLKGWKPKLIEYKNSGDVIGEKESVVGYASFWF